MNTHIHTINHFSIETDDLDLAGDLIQSLASYPGLQDLSVTASFPQQMKELSEVLDREDQILCKSWKEIETEAYKD